MCKTFHIASIYPCLYILYHICTYCFQMMSLILFFLPKFWLRIHANMKKPAYLINKRHSSFFWTNVLVFRLKFDNTKYIILRTHWWKPVVKGINDLRKKGFSFLTDKPSSSPFFWEPFVIIMTKSCMFEGRPC